MAPWREKQNADGITSVSAVEGEKKTGEGIKPEDNGFEGGKETVLGKNSWFISSHLLLS